MEDTRPINAAGKRQMSSSVRSEPEALEHPAVKNARIRGSSSRDGSCFASRDAGFGASRTPKPKYKEAAVHIEIPLSFANSITDSIIDVTRIEIGVKLAKSANLICTRLNLRYEESSSVHTLFKPNARTECGIERTKKTAAKSTTVRNQKRPDQTRPDQAPSTFQEITSSEVSRGISFVHCQCCPMHKNPWSHIAYVHHCCRPIFCLA